MIVSWAEGVVVCIVKIIIIIIIIIVIIIFITICHIDVIIVTKIDCIF